MGFFEDGKSAFAGEKYAKAIMLFSRSLMQAEIEHNVRAREESRQELARSFYRNGNFEEAKEEFIAIAQSADPKIKNFALSMLAGIDSWQGNHNQALKYLQQADPTPNNLITSAFVYCNIYKNGGYKYGFEKALDLLKRVNETDLRQGTKCSLKTTYGYAYRLHKDYDISEKYLLEAKAAAPTNTLRVRVLNELAEMFLEQNQYEKAEEAIICANDSLENVTDKITIADTYKLYGVLLLKKYENDDFAQKAKGLLEEASNIYKSHDLLMHLAEVNLILADQAYKSDPSCKYCQAYFDSLKLHADGRIAQSKAEEVQQKREKMVDRIDNGSLLCSSDC